MTSAPQPRSRPRRRPRIESHAGQPVPRESWDLGFALTIAGTAADEPARAEPIRRRRRSADQ